MPGMLVKINMNVGLYLLVQGCLVRSGPIHLADPECCNGSQFPGRHYLVCWVRVVGLVSVGGSGLG